MIDAIRPSATGPVGTRRGGARVEPTDPSARSETGARDEGASRRSETALVAIEAPQPRPSFHRQATSAPFLAQLVAAHLGASETAPGGERRVRRDPAVVMPRARAAYAAAARLSTVLEPGFLLAVDL